MSGEHRQQYLSLDSNTRSATLHYQAYPATGIMSARICDLNNSSEPNYYTTYYRSILSTPQYPKKNDVKDNILIAISIVFSILCIMPAPICGIVTIILSLKAIDESRNKNYRKKSKYAKWSLRLSILTVILGSVTLFCTVTICVAVTFSR